MKRRLLGRTGLEITVLGIGTWQLGGPETLEARGGEEDDAVVATIRRGLEAGINWIDTAPVYGLGRSELRVAHALHGLGERPLVFTKCGYVWDDRGRVRQTLRAASVRAEVEASLRRLEVEVIDLYQIHWPVPDEEIEEGWATLAELKAEGKVRHIGVSNFDLAQLRRAEAIAPVETLQPPYSLLTREIEGAELAYCSREDLGVIVYSPMAAGLLSGRMTRSRVEAFPDDEPRRGFPLFVEPLLTQSLAAADRLAAIGADAGVDQGALAIAWVLANPAVHGAIVGFRTPADVDSLLCSSDDDGRLVAALGQAFSRRRGRR